MSCSIVVLWLTVCTCHSIVLPAADEHSHLDELIKEIFDIPDVIDNKTHIVSIILHLTLGMRGRIINKVIFSRLAQVDASL